MNVITAKNNIIQRVEDVEKDFWEVKTNMHFNKHIECGLIVTFAYIQCSVAISKRQAYLPNEAKYTQLWTRLDKLSAERDSILGASVHEYDRCA